MRTVLKTIAILFVACISRAQSPPSPTTDKDHYRSVPYAPMGELYYTEYGLKKDLFSALGEWSNTPSSGSAARCQELAMQLVRSDEPSTSAYYDSARALELIGRQQEAIDVLGEILARRPYGASPGSVVESVQASANLWRGRLAANLGNFALARQSFAEARRPVENRSPLDLLRLKSVFYETQAEFSAAGGGTKKPAMTLELLRQEYVISAEPAPHGDPEFCSTVVDWLAKEGLVDIDGQALASVAPPLRPGHMEFSSYYALCAVGIVAHDDDDATKHWKGDRPEDKMTNILERYREQAGNKFDRAMILFTQAQRRVGLSFASSQDRRPAEIEKAIVLFRQLIAEDGFFAPWAEMGIVNCLALMGKTSEASFELDRIAAAWPGYAVVVGQAKEKLGMVQPTSSPPPAPPQPNPSSQPPASISAPATAATPVQAPVGTAVPSLETGNNHVALAVMAAIPVLALIGLGLWFWRKAKVTKRP